MPSAIDEILGNMSVLYDNMAGNYVDGATEHYNRFLPPDATMDPPVFATSLCPDGCQTKHIVLTSDGRLCTECGTVQPLAVGQATARNEFAVERVQFGHDARREDQQHVTENVPMTRVVPKVSTGSCRACVVRVIDRLTYNRVWARFVCALAARRKARFESTTKSWLDAFLKTIKTHVEVCARKGYTERTHGLNVAGRNAIKELNSRVAPAVEFTYPTVPNTVVVDGLEEIDEIPTGGSAVVLDPEPLNTIRARLRRMFQPVATLSQFRTVLSEALLFCTKQASSYATVGTSARRFLPTSPGFDPILRVLLSGTPLRFPTPELNACIRIRESTCVQSAAEHLLEAIVDENGVDHATKLVRALASSKLSEEAAATIIAENFNEKKFVAGLVTTSRQLAVHRRRCCDDPGCKQRMCIGLNSFFKDEPKRSNSEEQKATTESIDSIWTVQTRLLAGFAVCLSKRTDLVGTVDAIQLVKFASKETFLTSPFFAVRTSAFVSTATALLSLHGVKLFADVDERTAVKHNMSVQAVAITLGFWKLYFEPCFDAIGVAMFDDDTPETTRQCVASFTKVWTTQHAKFFLEKGNAAIDAALLYRAVQYDVLLRRNPELADQFAGALNIVDSGAWVSFPCPPPSLFKSQVQLDSFASEVTQCMLFVRNAADAGSSNDNALVRYTKATFLDFDAIEAACGNNILADVADGESDRLAPPDKFTALKIRAVDLNSADVLRCASAAADRIQIVLPTFWSDAWCNVPTLANVDINNVRALVGIHPAAGLLKRLDDTPYLYSADSDGNLQFAADAFATSYVKSQLSIDGADSYGAKVVQQLVDMEVALSRLMHGTRVNDRSYIGSVVHAEPHESPTEAAIAALCTIPEKRRDTQVSAPVWPLARKRIAGRPDSTSSLRKSVCALVSPQFLIGLRDFCDSLATKAMETQLRNAMPGVGVCPVRNCVAAYFEDEAHAVRAFHLHVARLERAVLRTKNATHSTTDDAQRAVELEGDDRLKYSPEKRQLHCKYTASLAATAAEGYSLLSLLAGSVWVARDVHVEFDLSATPDAVNTRLGSRDLDLPEILRTIEKFARLVNGLKRSASGFTHVTTDHSKINGVKASVGFLSRPLHESFFTDRFWIPFDAIASTIQSEIVRIKKRGVRDIVVVRAVERSAATLGNHATVRQRARRQTLDDACIVQTAAMDSRWRALDPVRKNVIMTIATTLDAAPFDIFCMRGVAAVVVGCTDIDPAKLFSSTYHTISNIPIPTAASTAACESLFVELQRAIVRLNTGTTTLSEIPSFYRHRVVVQFLCAVAAKKGTIREQAASSAIRTANFCFLEQRSSRFFEEQLTDGVPIEPTEAEVQSASDAHLEAVRASRLARDTAEERVAVARSDGNGIGNCRRDAIRLGVGDM